MLTPDQIDAIRDRATQISDPLIEYLLSDIARRIANAGQLTSTAAYQIWRAQQLGMSRKEISAKLKELLKVSNADIKKLLTQTAETGYNFDIKRLPTTSGIPFSDNLTIQQTVSAAVKLAQDDFTNITQTIGMVDPYGNALPLQDAYRKTMDFAFEKVFTGAADYNTAIRQATANLAKYGLRTIDYESGVHTSIEAATRRNIMGGLGLMQEQISDYNHDTLGCNGWEISAHAACAPDHEPIQGRQYSDADYKTLNDSLVRRIGTLNCGHAAFPIILGVSKPQYTPEELVKMKQDNSDGVTYQGRHYTTYEATQQQRKLERTMRFQKRRILIDEATGDKETLTTDQIRLRRLEEEYKRFSKASGLRTQQERLEVSGFGPKQATQANIATDREFKEMLAKAAGDDKIILSKDMESIIAGKPYSEISALNGKLSDRAARKWYLAQDSEITSKIDRSQPVEDQARQACELRNQNRTQARELMRDQKKRQQLDATDPNKSFEELLLDKMQRKGLTREQAIEDVLGTAAKTRNSVNKSLGLG